MIIFLFVFITGILCFISFLYFRDKKCSILTTRLEKTYKGTSLIANKDIKKDELISYYKMKVFNLNGYKGVNNNMYIFNVHNKYNKYFSNLVGDIYDETIENPINGITFWGHLANEPSIDQKPNSKIVTFSDKNLEGDVKEGDIIVYELVATENIKKNDEITWCYGKYYKRNYTICKDCEQ